MKSLTRAVLAGVAAALVAAGCSTASHEASSTHKPAPTHAAAPIATTAPSLSTGQYVALGDSYVAAPKTSAIVGTPKGCGRSTDSYPMLVAQRLGLAASRVHDVSCDGATIPDLTGSQATSDGANPAQLSALSPTTTLVTVGIGGNDVHWTTVLTQCAKLDLGPVMTRASAAAKSSECKKFYTAGGKDQVQQYIQAIAKPLSAVLAEFKHRSPNARVFVVGYPDLMPASGNVACEREFGITDADMAFLNSAEQRLNGMLRQQADAAHATYVDTYTASLGHDACATRAKRWVEPWLPASPAYPLHPNALGEQGIANAVISAMATAK